MNAKSMISRVMNEILAHPDSLEVFLSPHDFAQFKIEARAAYGADKNWRISPIDSKYESFLFADKAICLDAKASDLGD